MSKLVGQTAKISEGKVPLVSVIMNCYNGEKYIREAIDSVISQTYQNWEIIFWDNQSTDRSAEIVKGYNEPRIRYVYAQKHTLLYEARNYAIVESSGEYIAFLDVDDRWVEEKLENQVKLFDDPGVGLVCSNFWVVSECKNKRWLFHKKPLRTGRVLNEQLKNYRVGLLTLMIRRTSFEALDLAFNPKYHIIGDFDLVIRLLVSWKLDCVHLPLAEYRLHDSNETALNKSRHVNEMNDWIHHMLAVKGISSCSNFNIAKQKATYLQAMGYILDSDIKNALTAINNMPFGTLKLRLLLAIMIPSYWVKKFKK